MLLTIYYKSIFCIDYLLFPDHKQLKLIKILNVKSPPKIVTKANNINNRYFLNLTLFS